MKKFVTILLAVSLILGGCTSKGKNITNQENGLVKKEEKAEGTGKDQKIEVNADEIMAKYNELGEDRPYELMAFMDENIEKLPKEKANEMMNRLEKIQKIKEHDYTNDLFENEENMKILYETFKDGYSKNKIYRIEKDDLRDLLLDMANGGYTLIMSEGIFYPMIDYTYLKKYTSYVTDEMKAYIEIMSVEADHPTMEDASVLISWNELANRALKVENFLGKYKKSTKKSEMAELYTFYLRAYLMGAPNSYVYNWETKKIEEEILNSYKSTISENEGTKTAIRVKEYLNEIEKNNLKINEKIEDKGNHILKEVSQELGVEEFVN